MSKRPSWGTCSLGGLIKLAKKRAKRSPLPRTPLSTPTPEGGSAVSTWGLYQPIIDHNKCSKCGLCWLYCPEGAVKVDGVFLPHVDLVFCKGCGICARECPLKVINMKLKGVVKDETEKDSGRW